MKDILEEIIACKQKEIENLRQIVKEDILCAPVTIALFI